MTGFDPSKLGKYGSAGTKKSPKSERLFIEVGRYETPSEGFHFAVGHKVGKPEEKVKVRLNTVNERLGDRPNDNIEKIKSLYISGENTRDSIGDKQKAGIKLLSFDDARKIGKTDDGVEEYRAHWPVTMSTNPNAEVMSGFGHMRLRDATEVGGKRINAQAYIELLKSSVVVDKNSIDKVLEDALSIKDSQNRARDPLAILRVLHEGKVVASPRVYPSFEVTKVFDQNLGEQKQVHRKVDAHKTIHNLISAKPSSNEMADRQLDMIRALIAGIKEDKEPKLNSQDEGVRDSIKNLYWGAKAGALAVEVISAEKIDFGADSRKTYLSNRQRPQLSAYTIKEQIDENHAREVTGYLQTVIAAHRHPDGEPYAVFASPVAMYPKAQKLADLPFKAIGEPAAQLKAKVETPVVEPEIEPDDVGYEP